MAVDDQQGIGTRLKNAVPLRIRNILRPTVNWLASLVPDQPKYSIGVLLRRSRYPYSVVRSGDTVIQVGAPRDLLKAGRSRAVHFARLVGQGRVIVVEPDPVNCRELRRFVARNRLESIVTLVEKGAWNAKGELSFLSSAVHPAANVLVDARDVEASLSQERRYEIIKVPVSTLDEIVKVLNLSQVRLVSVTTNGAEPQIIQGMTEIMALGVPYVSLAKTGEGYPELMEQRDYCLLAADDRGFTFRSRQGKET